MSQTDEQQQQTQGLCADAVEAAEGSSSSSTFEQQQIPQHLLWGLLWLQQEQRERRKHIKRAFSFAQQPSPSAAALSCCSSTPSHQIQLSIREQHLLSLLLLLQHRSVFSLSQ